MDLDNDRHFPAGLIQVAGVGDLDEAAMLLEEGVDLIGIPLRLTVNAEDLTEEAAAGISKQFPGKVCLITYLAEPGEIVALANYLAVDWIQLHGETDPGILPAIREAMPGVRIIKSLIVGKGSTADLLELIKGHSPHVDAFITDTFNAETGAEGATGQTHDWSVSRHLVAASARPVILAGGLRPDNVEVAVRTVRPYGVDVHSGVEDTAGRKDRILVKAFIEAARRGFSTG
jgi:phosphoribosylanthranilate isomerase